MKNNRIDKTSRPVRLRARQLCRQMTHSETVLWDRLRGRQLAGLKFRRQCPIGPFIADFFCSECKLVVEVDGGVHNDQGEADAQRSRRLAEYGYRVLRVNNREVERDLAGVLVSIQAACQSGSKSPLASGEGDAAKQRRG